MATKVKLYSGKHLDPVRHLSRHIDELALGRGNLGEFYGRRRLVPDENGVIVSMGDDFSENVQVLILNTEEY